MNSVLFAAMLGATTLLQTSAFDPVLMEAGKSLLQNRINTFLSTSFDTTDVKAVVKAVNLNPEILVNEIAANLWAVDANTFVRVTLPASSETKFKEYVNSKLTDGTVFAQITWDISGASDAVTYAVITPQGNGNDREKVLEVLTSFYTKQVEESAQTPLEARKFELLQDGLPADFPETTALHAVFQDGLGDDVAFFNAEVTCDETSQDPCGGTVDCSDSREVMTCLIRYNSFCYGPDRCVMDVAYTGFNHLFVGPPTFDADKYKYVFPPPANPADKILFKVSVYTNAQATLNRKCNCAVTQK